ncbi:MAG: DNA methylase, partial [Lachnospiraceae bacterium]|nr:DNA methylase [Lachnospiraceae bacterium]
EMTELLVLDLVAKKLVTDQLVLTVGYDIENLSNSAIRQNYKGLVTVDRYGRQVPKHAHGTANIDRKTSSTKLIMEAVMDLYDRIVDKDLLVRRVNISANHIVDEESVIQEGSFEQMDLFSYFDADKENKEQEEKELEREKKIQQAMLKIKNKYGKNAILKGINLEEGGMTIERNKQIGGHKA